jgi:cytidylate kinase
MGFQVVCISRSLAAGGEMVGQAVAQRLGFDYVDEEVIAKAAAKANVDPGVVAAAETKRPLIKRLIEAIGMAQGMADPLGFATGLPLELSYYQAGIVPAATASEDYRTLIREAIREIAGEGRAVIVAHAASMALAGSEGVLRVLVTASAETRAQRLVEAEKISESKAVSSVADSDRARRDYFHRFYGVKEELPTHYDIVVNTDVLTPEQAVSLIVGAAQA